MLRKGVKIFKFINQRSALDVSANLEYYKDKRDKDEMEYKGNIVVSIAANGNYLKAYVSKTKAKSLFQSIVDGNFSKLYPEGFTDYGGSVREGQIISRTLKIETKVSEKKDKKGMTEFDKNGKPKLKIQIVFTISEGPGQKTQTGAYKPTGKTTSSVQSYLDPMSMRECAIETLSYIQAAEIVAQLVGRPLHTLTSVSQEEESEIGIQNLINQNTNILAVIENIPNLSNEELKKLTSAAQNEYQKRVNEYKKTN